MSFNLTTSGAIIDKAGAYVNSTAVASGALLSLYCDMAEATLCGKTRYDWVANIESVGTNFKPMLSDVVSDLAATKLINYDMSGYTSRTEAQTMLDVLSDNANSIIKDLREMNIKEVML